MISRKKGGFTLPLVKNKKKKKLFQDTKYMNEENKNSKNKDKRNASV